ncbi:hypothetical protein [Collimonas silvisoli]|uniref:hypothetical protein n=1 Tax=Collimonas silvisoli TaxID=2825884 RepID=UPI001B8BCF08|nr:hypothetical protein [Collimonas silvisoli]
MMVDLHGIAHSLTKSIQDTEEEKRICNLANSQLDALEKKVYRIAQKLVQKYFWKLCRLTVPAACVAIVVGALINLFEPAIERTLVGADVPTAGIVRVAGSLALVFGGAFSGAWFKEALYFKLLSKKQFNNDLILNIDGGPLTIIQRLLITIFFALIVTLLLYGGALQIKILGVDVGDYKGGDRYWVAFALGFVLAVAELRFMKRIYDVFSKQAKMGIEEE